MIGRVRFRLLKGDYCLESDLIDPILAKKAIKDRKSQSLSFHVPDVYKLSEAIQEEEEEDSKSKSNLPLPNDNNHIVVSLIERSCGLRGG